MTFFSIVLDVITNVNVLNAWNPETAEGNIRKVFGLIIGILVAYRVTAAYKDGKIGKAILQGGGGGLISLFVFDSSAFMKLMGWFGNLLGL